MTAIVTIGIDLAKNVFAVHGVDVLKGEAPIISAAPALPATRSPPLVHSA